MSDAAIIEHAAACLRAGELVAFPTETVYGLGADATNNTAVARIFAAKGRPQFNPLIIHVSSLEEARALVIFDARAEALARAFWPGPLTLVLPRPAFSPISLLCSAGLDSIAVRIPAHPLATALLKAMGRPIAGPSANRSGRISPTTADHVREELGDLIKVIVDGGACAIGLESTVLDLTSSTARLLRPGSIPCEALQQHIGPVAKTGPVAAGALPSGPGMLASHYAPSRRVRLNARHPQPGEAFLAFGPLISDAVPDAQLSSSGDLIDAAARLFAFLRLLDRPPFSAIAVMPIPEQGLGIAINDRLKRAAAPR